MELPRYPDTSGDGRRGAIMMNPAWPKRIDRGRAEASLRNGREPASQKTKSGHVFG
jgi:hypothetical protein